MFRLGLLTHNFPLRPDGASDAGSFAADLASMLRGPDCEVTVFCQSLGPTVQPANEIQIHQFQWSGEDWKLGHLEWTNPRHLARLFSYFQNGRREVLKFVKDYDIQYCLALWVVPSGYFAYYAGEKLGVPYTVWALGSDINKYYRFGLRGLMRRVLARADHVLADGLDLVRKIEAVTGEGRCRFLPSSRNLLNGGSGTVLRPPGCRFLFVGRLEPVKGIDLLIPAFARVAGKTGNPVLEIIGTGSLQEETVGAIRNHHLEGRVEFRGSVSNAELREAYRRSHCLVIPSRSESLPLVFSEAAQFGLPVIAADVGDLRHFVELYQAGLVVPPESVDALAMAMNSFVDGRINWSPEGVGRAAKELSLAGSVEKLTTLIGLPK
jgi:glycosyltransferase involved in cell wall biosynthesis